MTVIYPHAEHVRAQERRAPVGVNVRPQHMHQVTLDTNCLLDLEESNERAAAVRELVVLHETRRIDLRIPAITASERQRGGTYFGSFSDFVDRLGRLGLGSIPLILPMFYFGVAFWGRALYAGKDMLDLERKIHSILHPEVKFDYASYCIARGIDPDAKPLDRKWRNAKCDVQVMWSHIYHGGKTLVTNDENFVKATKLPRLVALGAGAVARTSDAAAHLDLTDQG